MEPIWPRIGSEPANLKEHATVLHEAFAHLRTVKGHATAIPADIIDPYIELTLHLLLKVSQHLTDHHDATALTSQPRDLMELTAQRAEHIKEHEAIKTAIQTATAPLLNATPQGRVRVASWAQVAAGAAACVTPPDSLLSCNSSTLTAYKGREVIIKLADHGLAQRFLQLSPVQLKNKINNILLEVPKVRDIKIAAAHQHGIPVNTINAKDQPGTIQWILADNHSVIPNAEITYVGWLTKESTKK